MSFKKHTHPDNPPARNGCTCSCHTSLALVKHVRACCPREPALPEVSRRVFAAFDFYQKECLRTKMPGTDRIFFKNSNGELVPVPYMYSGMGLGEAGEVQNKIKKVVRDKDGVITPEVQEAIKGELGGLLWYIATCANDFNIPFSEIPAYNIDQLRDRLKRGVIKGSGDNR